MTMLRAHTRGRPIRTAENNRAAHLTARHIKRFRGRIDNMINGLHRKVPCHELNNRAQTAHGSTDTNTRKTMLGNRRVNHAAISKFL